ncbi:putative glycosidase CRH2 [Coemansia sp. RSA 922]|nr:putative glycosidase CRH2 [Coemansia sp. RSA 922]
MKAPILLGVVSLFMGHALGACTGMNAADRGICPTDKCQALDEDFSLVSALDSSSSISASSNSSFISEQQPDHASIKSGGLVLSLKRSPNGSGYEGSTAYFRRWIHYGTITAVVRSGSTAPGVVSSLQLQDSIGSSIDMDWVGISSNRVQANYYTSGQLELSQAAAPILPIDPTDTFIEYRIVWLPNSLTWYANGLAVRTVNRRDTWAEGEQRFHYPDQPARLSFSIWDSANSINPGLTQAWAGSLATYSTDTQFTMAVKSVTVQCYSNFTMPVSHDTNATQTASSTLAPTTGTPPAPSSVPSSNLSNFGREPEQPTRLDSSRSISSAVSPSDDLSNWLAGITSTSSSGPSQHLGTMVGICMAISIAALFGL